ncbi:MAG: GIY-YIG nuclease family protein [Alphaproteobacteria bacterium]|nr:GIY-YIG nuclease family protein [Alphaproteobacteria bacterium]
MSSDPLAYFVYVLHSRSGITYTGIAKDVKARLARHNAGTGARFTKGRGPWRVVHVEGPLSHGDAARRECAIKKDRQFKIAIKARASNDPECGPMNAGP